MKCLLIAAAAFGLIGLASPAAAMPMGQISASDNGIVLVKGGHGHGGHHGWGHRGGHGHHYGWSRGRGHHYGWSHHRYHR